VIHLDLEDLEKLQIATDGPLSSRKSTN